MSEQTPSTETSWVTPLPDVVESPRVPEGMSTRAKAGVLATAAVVGALGVLALQGSGSAATAQQGGFGGVSGTVSAISSSSITVAGTTASVSDATEVVVDGRRGSLSDVKEGDTVFLHTEGSVAERIFVGGLPFGGPGGPPAAQQGNGTTSST